MYNPDTYPWYQCDEEDYDSNASTEEQAEMAAARKQEAEATIAAMRAAVTTVPSYCERDLSQEGTYDDLVAEHLELDEGDERVAAMADGGAFDANLD